MARVLPITLLVLSTAPAAFAQNALGDGRMLQQNANQTYGQTFGQNFSTRQNLSSALQFQNAIVTGNAPGGLSFRGDVGYLAPGEFGGETGGTENFAFRRDSFYSGLQGRGIRGSEALQLQFNLMTGSNAPSNLQGSLIANRPQTGAYAENYAEARANALYSGRPYNAMVQSETSPEFNLQPLDYDAPDFDPRGRELMINNVRSTSSMLANDPIRAQIIDTKTGTDGTQYDVTATSLGGVNLVPLEKMSMTVDRAAPATVKSPVSEAQGDLVQPISPDSFLPEGVRSYESILKDLQNIELPPIENLPEGIEQPEMLELPESGPEVQAWKMRLLDLRRSLRLEPGARPDDDDATPNRGIDPITVNMLKRTEGTIDVLSPIGAGGVDSYSVNMHYAEDLLAKGRFFDAEEQFARALRARPGDPMAAVGRAHAEIGAGMYLSAVLNLRELFTGHPELINSRYAPEILPTSQRLEAVKADLLTKLQGDTGLPREAGLVLAYIGYQTRDQAAISTGLSIAEKAAEDNADERAARLTDLLRSLWVAETAPVGQDE